MTDSLINPERSTTTLNVSVRQAPTIGRIVVYRLNEQDAATINLRRAHADRSNIADQRSGVQVHFGNNVEDGMDFPAIVVRVWGQPDLINLQVFLDGNDTYWATSRHESSEPENGMWRWPNRM